MGLGEERGHRHRKRRCQGIQNQIDEMVEQWGPGPDQSSPELTLLQALQFSVHSPAYPSFHAPSTAYPEHTITHTGGPSQRPGLLRQRQAGSSRWRCEDVLRSM